MVGLTRQLFGANFTRSCTPGPLAAPLTKVKHTAGVSSRDRDTDSGALDQPLTGPASLLGSQVPTLKSHTGLLAEVDTLFNWPPKPINLSALARDSPVFTSAANPCSGCLTGQFRLLGCLG